jgi:hypothetical protein
MDSDLRSATRAFHNLKSQRCVMHASMGFHVSEVCLQSVLAQP